MTSIEPRRSAIHRPPPEISARNLRELLWTTTAVKVLDVREEAAFRPRHLPNSVNAPDSRTTTLIKKVQEAGRVVLVCEDGRLSALVARTLGVCGFPDVAFLSGGIKAWVEAGGTLMETTRSGNELVAAPPEDPKPLGWVGRVCRRITPRVVFFGIAAASALLLIVVRLVSA